MSDLIERQATITLPVMPKEYREYQTFNLDDAYEQGWNDLQKCIESLPSAQPEVLAHGEGELSAQPEPQWISCERELPEDYTDVLAWFEYFRYGDYNCLYQTYGIGSYSMKYDSWTINHETGWHKLRVIAWMPLPEPWRGEENEKK